jgi:hypothetical protein
LSLIRRGGVPSGAAEFIVFGGMGVSTPIIKSDIVFFIENEWKTKQNRIIYRLLKTIKLSTKRFIPDFPGPDDNQKIQHSHYFVNNLNDITSRLCE